LRQNIDKNINSLLIPPKEFPPKKSSQKNPHKIILPKNFSQKIPPNKFLQKNPPKNSKKNPKKIQKNSQKISKILKVSNSLHRTCRPKTLSGLLVSYME
jgi:hypothetical protein